jgi:hypothetical protein
MLLLRPDQQGNDMFLKGCKNFMGKKLAVEISRVALD